MSKLRLPIHGIKDPVVQRALRLLEDAYNTLDLEGGAGPAGPAGPTGPAGPAPSGTGVVNVTSGVLGTPYTDTQLTTHIDAFTSGLKGAVPASGGGTINYLRADGTFAEPPGTFDSSNVGLGFFGTGSDGSAVFDGGAAAGLTTFGAYTTRGVTYNDLYVLVKDLHLDDCTIDSDVAVFTNGYRLFVKGTLVLNGLIGCWGDDAGAGTLTTGGVGTASRTAHVLGSSGGGGAGGNVSTGVPASGAPTTNLPSSFSGTRGKGGTGGANHLGTTPSNAGTTTFASVDLGDLNNIFQAISGNMITSTGRHNGGSGGGGGRGGVIGGGAQGGGGGGGAGGAPAVVCAREVTGSGFVGSHGGNGGAGFSGGGGGGGGGGSWATVVIGTGSFPAINVTGGTGGAAGGVGASTAGASGGDGNTYLYKVGA